MSDSLSDKKMLDDITSTLDKSCDQLDGHTLSRLHKIRHDAIHSSRQGKTRLLAPFGGLATVCLVVMVAFLWNQSPVIQTGADSVIAIEDLDLMASPDNIELYENFEFYQWLAENESSI